MTMPKLTFTHQYKAGLLKTCLALFVCLFATTAIQAGVEPFENTVRGSIKKGDTLWVKDEKFRSPSFDWNTIQNQKARNFIEFRILQDTNRMIPAPLTCTLRLKIEYYTSPDQPEPITINNVDLSVSYLSDTGSQNKLFQLYSFENAHLVKITVDSVMSPQFGNNVPPFLQLSSKIIVDRKYVFNPAAPILPFYQVPESGNASFNTEVSPPFGGSIQTANNITLTWSTVGNDEFDIEWAAIDRTWENETVFQQLVINGTVSANELDNLFRNNATRVTTPANSYQVTMSHYSQYLFFRIRAVNYTKITQGTEEVIVREEGEWQYRKDNNTFALFPIDWHEPNLNWQYTASYAEEGKKKEVISYFDGSLRGRQMVTINSTDNRTIIKENIYDEFGRPVVNILPSPIASSLLKFHPNQHRNTTGQPYTFKDVKGVNNNCEPTPGQLSNTSGAAAYYSSNYITALSNPDLNQNPFLKYIPDAEGYPFTVTHYTPDNTGRVRVQGGVGKEFQPSSTQPSHTTKYFYGKPEQTELDRIFGNDAGYAEHYLKNMVVDPNGQTSVSYVDASGRTVATALTGTTPANVESLPGKPNAKTETIKLIWPSQFTYEPSTLSLKASTTYLASVTGAATLNYDVKRLVYQYRKSSLTDGFALCHECHYNLTVKVFDDCGQLLNTNNTVVGIGTENFTVIANGGQECSSLPNNQAGIPLNFTKVGEYSVNFELTLLKNTMDNYLEQYVTQRKQRNDLTTEYEFVKTYLNTEDFSSCFTDCKTCTEELGTKENFTAAVYKALADNKIEVPSLFTADFSTWVSNKYDALKAACTASQIGCNVSPCDRYKRLMLQDVSPGGQYALFDEQGNPQETELNIIYNSWRNNAAFPILPDTDPAYSNTQFELEDGTIISPHDASFTIVQLIKYWKPEWAERFLSFHPEYCKLQFCNNNAASYSFDQIVQEEITKASQLPTHPLTNGLNYVPPVAPQFLLSKDPFFTTGAGAGFFNAMSVDLLLFTQNVLQLTSAPSHKSITGYVDFLLYCAPKDNTTNSIANPANPWASCTPKPECRVTDREWELYKKFYFQTKEIYYEKVRSLIACPNTCTVGDDLEITNGTVCPRKKDFKVLPANQSTLCTGNTKTVTINSVRGAFNGTVTVNYLYLNGTTPVTGSVVFLQGETKKEICIPNTIASNQVYITGVSCQLNTASGNDCPPINLDIPATKISSTPTQTVYQYANTATNIVTTWYIIKSSAQPDANSICSGINTQTSGPAQFKKCLKVYSTTNPTVPEIFFNVWVVTCTKDLCSFIAPYNFELQYSSHSFYGGGKTYYISSSTGSATPACANPELIASNIPCIRVNVPVNGVPTQLVFNNATVYACENCTANSPYISVTTTNNPNVYTNHLGTYLIYPNTTEYQINSTSYCTNAVRNWYPCINLNVSVNGQAYTTSQVYNATVFFCANTACTNEMFPGQIFYAKDRLLGPAAPNGPAVYTPLPFPDPGYNYHMIIVPHGSPVPVEYQNCPNLRLYFINPTTTNPRSEDVCLTIAAPGDPFNGTSYGYYYSHVDVYVCDQPSGFSAGRNTQSTPLFPLFPIYGALKIAEYHLPDSAVVQIKNEIYSQVQPGEQLYVSKTDNVIYLVRKDISAISSVPPQRQHFKQWEFKEHFFVRLDTNYYFNFRNVWVASYAPTDTTNPNRSNLKQQIKKVTVGKTPQSNTTNSLLPEDMNCSSLLQYKIPRFPVINFSSFNPNTVNNNPEDQINIGIQQLQTQIDNNCETFAEIWAQQLSDCFATLNQTQKDAIIQGLTAVCKAGGDIDHPNGTSTSIVATQYGDKSFKDVFIRVLGPQSLSMICNPLLLPAPYPRDVKVQQAEIIISNSTTGICTKLQQYQNDFAATPGSATSLHQYLTGRFNTTDYTYYTLTEQELNALIKSCGNCKNILDVDIKLPPILNPDSKGCITRAEFNTAVADFTVSGFTAAGMPVTMHANYYKLMATYMNHRFGFTLTADDYESFEKTPARTLLCTEPLYTSDDQEQYVCLTGKMQNAIVNGLREYEQYIEEQKRQFRLSYISACMNSAPMVTLTAQLQTYHYTLYYYDQAGSLVRTVPPAGVKLLSDAEVIRVDRYRRNLNANCVYNGPNADSDISENKMNLNETLAAAGNRSMEAWFYNSTPGSLQYLTGTIPFISTSNYDHYFVQLCVNNGKLSAEIYTMQQPSAAGGIQDDISFLLSNHQTVDLAGLALEEWTHVVVQGNNLPGGTLSIYVNGTLMPAIAGAPPVGCGWEVTNPTPSTSSLPQNYEHIKHLRLYNRQLTAAEILANANSQCFAIEFNRALNDPLTWWGRFNTPTGPGITNNWQNTTNETRILPVYPNHQLVTTYNYNSLGQVTTQKTPDAGTSKFWYDMLGRLVLSQNAKQFAIGGTTSNYSYTKYDDLGRISEVGERVPTIALPGTGGYLTNTQVSNYLQSGYGTQVTQTFYDFIPASPPAGFNTTLALKNLRKRVAATVYREQDNAPVTQASYYSYDIAGNVHTLWQQVNGLGTKQIKYEYDLVSGKVNTVSYQHGQPDQFYYHYKYDAENRLIEAQSSNMATVLYNLTTQLDLPQTDATYKYYPHGPLAKTELGHTKVQGVDYAYTLQGWLKGINSHQLNADTDIGEDGKITNPFYSINARDVMSYTLGYYFGDYKPVGFIGGNANAFNMPFANTATGFGANLYNGNIGHTTVALSQLNSGSPVGYTYKYDQLNRIVAMQQQVLATNTTAWGNTTGITQAYAESYTYDANGNILTLNRNGNKPTGWRMDELTYHYIPNSNKLGHVTDAIGANAYTDAEVKDVETQAAGNYQYDEIGNMTKDVAEGIDIIQWTVYGKIRSITKTNGTTISYAYDAAGNRVQKTVSGAVGLGNATITYYVRDAQGNTLALYEQVNSGTITLTEQHLYGSSRLGIYKPVQPGITIARREYELSNHLGNVLAVISDRKLPVDVGNNGTIDYYTAEVLSQNDYYPFGMSMPGRKYSAAGGYRYGFNGKEKSDEIVEGDLDFGARIYDSRLGRWLSVDPQASKYPDESPYVFAANSPILYIDPDGEKRIVYYITTNYQTGERVVLSYYKNDDVKSVSRKALKCVHTCNHCDYVSKHYETVYDWHDINEVHNIVIDKNGNRTETVSENLGEKRLTTGLNFMWGAKFSIGEGYLNEPLKNKSYSKRGGSVLYSRFGQNGETTFTTSIDVDMLDVDELIKLLNAGIQNRIDKNIITSLNNVATAHYKAETLEKKRQQIIDLLGLDGSNSSTPRIEPGKTKKPADVKFYYPEPGEKKRKPANKEKGLGQGQKMSNDPSKPDTIFYQQTKKN
jgi:RHS repeat-associated protein